MVTKISMRATIKEMEPRQEVEIPLKMYGHNSVRNCASLLGQDLGRRYSVSVNRAAGYTKVTRIQ